MFENDFFNFKNLRSKKKIIRCIVLIVMSLIFVSGLFSVNALSHDYIIIDGDSIMTVKLVSSDLDKILEKANIKLSKDDVAIKNEKDGTIVVKRAFDVTIHVDDYTVKGTFVDGSVGYALDQLNVTLGKNDTVSPGLTDALVPDMDITVKRCSKISIKDSGKNTEYVVPNGTVQEALDYLHITLGSDDTISITVDNTTSTKMEQQVKDEMKIEIKRVGYHEKTVKEEIPYATHRLETEELPLGKTEQETAGSVGERMITTLEKYVDGELVESTPTKNIVTIMPVDEIILVGIGESTSDYYTSSNNSSANETATVYGDVLIDENGNVVNYKSVLTGSATAYTASPGALTSTGRVAQYGYVAVNPNIIPYGSKLYICSPDGSFVYGYAIATDTGSALMNGEALVDCYYPTYEECVAFGRKNICVYIIE